MIRIVDFKIQAASYWTNEQLQIFVSIQSHFLFVDANFCTVFQNTLMGALTFTAADNDNS